METICTLKTVGHILGITIATATVETLDTVAICLQSISLDTLVTNSGIIIVAFKASLLTIVATLSMLQSQSSPTRGTNGSVVLGTLQTRLVAFVTITIHLHEAIVAFGAVHVRRTFQASGFTLVAVSVFFEIPFSALQTEFWILTTIIAARSAVHDHPFILSFTICVFQAFLVFITGATFFRAHSALAILIRIQSFVAFFTNAGVGGRTHFAASFTRLAFGVNQNVAFLTFIAGGFVGKEVALNTVFRTDFAGAVDSCQSIQTFVTH